MTTLYRPVPIESAEQAEALPIGTVVIRTRAGAIEKGIRGWWSGLTRVPDRTPIGSTALVPIEAEEETRVTPEALAAAAGQMVARAEEAARTYALPPTPLTIQQQTRLVTPWEAV